jgi:hypothetical protein
LALANRFSSGEAKRETVKHLTLRNVVRGTGLIIFLLFVVHALGWTAFLVLSSEQNFSSLAVIIFFLILALIVAYAGWRMFWRVDQAGVANFCFAISAAVVYLLEPLISRQFDFGSLAPVFIGLGLFFGLYLSLVKPLTRVILSL